MKQFYWIMIVMYIESTTEIYIDFTTYRKRNTSNTQYDNQLVIRQEININIHVI